MQKRCHFLYRKTTHVLKVQILMRGRGLPRDGLPLKLVVGCLDLLSQLIHDVD